MSDFDTVNRPDAYGGAAVVALVDGDGTSLVTTSVEVDEERTCTLWARVWGPNGSQDAFYAGIDGNISRRYPDAYGVWRWVNCRTETLAAGTHTISFGAGELGAILDVLVLTDVDLTPAQLDIRLGGQPGGGGVDPEPDPDPVGDTSLLGDPDYNPSARTWKTDGSLITGDALDAVIGLEWWRNNNASHADGTTTSKIRDDLYVIGRDFRDRMQAMFVALRLTGDLRFLDSIVTWMNLSKAYLAVGYREHNSGVVTWSASPYKMIVTKGGGQPSNLYGTDLSVMNEVKWNALIAEYTWALWLNRNYTSPGGHNYQTQYDYWIDYLTNHFVPKWSGGTISSWRVEYRGVRRTPTYGSSSPGVGPQRYGRAAAGQWPIAVNGGDIHSTQSTAILEHYMGLLTSNQNALDDAQWIVERFKDTDSVVVGTARFWGHSAKSHGSTSTLAQGATYVSYTMMDYASMYLEGAWSAITPAMLTQMAEALQDHMWIQGITSDSSGTVITRGHIVGTSGKDWLTLGSYTGRTQYQMSINPALMLARWGVDSYLVDEAKRLLTNKESWNGTITQPKSPFNNAAILLAGAPL